MRPEPQREPFPATRTTDTRQHPTRPLILALITLVGAGCSDSENLSPGGNTPATEATVRAQQAARDTMPETDEDIEAAGRGLLASLPDLQISDHRGNVVWNQSQYGFVQGEAPDTVNPSLWRQETLNNRHGLFKVTEGIYQLRGFDLANMTLIEGNTGWIVIDPLTTPDTARAALAFAQEHLGKRPVSAILITHSHIDHFGGILGITTEEQVRSGEIPLYAPAGFLAEATSENILLGLAMGRRAEYMYGLNLPVDARGHIGSGLGKQPAFGQFSLLEPNFIVQAPFESHLIDGVRFEFQTVSGSEAPAEFTFYLPEKQAFCGAELVSHTLHNLYTLRGAKVRDALKWSHFIDDAIQRFSGAEIYFGSHHWPVWGKTRVQAFLETQRDTYKYLHDQTVRRMNQGWTADEIAEQIHLPVALTRGYSNRDYYGTLRHNVKAIYQYYLGWYDGNPAHLNPLPESTTAGRYIELMGGKAAVLKAAQRAFDEGDYRWAAELLNKLVFASPEDSEASRLLARTYDQLGYQSESGPWRDNYLTAAHELRHGPSEKGVDIQLMENVLLHTPMSRFFESMATRLDSEAAEGQHVRVVLEFTDLAQSWLLEVKNGVLHHRLMEKTQNPPDIQAHLALTKPLFVALSIRKAGLGDILLSDELTLTGSKLDFLQFLRLFDQPDGRFPLVRP